MKLKVSVIGLGYLGATTAVAFAKLGHEVIGIDSDSAKLDSLSAGKVPFYEPGLDEALQEVLRSGNLRFKTQHDEESRDVLIHLLCVGTPQSKTGLGADTTYLFNALDSLAPFLNEDALVAGKSTVPVGTAAALAVHLASEVDFEPHLAWNPEFLREGTALQDSLLPDRIVIGVKEAWSEKLLRLLYEPITNQGVPLLTVDIPTAELVKVAANSFLATKISFINAMAEIAEVAGAGAEGFVEPVRKLFGALADVQVFDEALARQALQLAGDLGTADHALGVGPGAFEIRGHRQKSAKLVAWPAAGRGASGLPTSNRLSCARMAVVTLARASGRRAKDSSIRCNDSCSRLST